MSRPQPLETGSKLSTQSLPERLVERIFEFSKKCKHKWKEKLFAQNISEIELEHILLNQNQPLNSFLSLFEKCSTIHIEKHNLWCT